MLRTNLLRAFGVAIALFVSAAAPVQAEDAPKPSDHWILYFDGASNTDGDLVLHLAPEQGEPKDVTTRIPKGTTENSAAELLVGMLKGSLGGGYKVKLEDGEKVYIKTTGKTPKFVLSLGSNSSTGLNIKIKRG